MSSGLGSGTWNLFGSRKACKGDHLNYLGEGYKSVTMLACSIRMCGNIYRIWLRTVPMFVKANATISFKDLSKHLMT